MQNTQMLEKVLIQIMYERGEINKATYERVVQKLKKEVVKNGKLK